MGRPRSHSLDPVAYAVARRRSKGRRSSRTRRAFPREKRVSVCYRDLRERAEEVLCHNSMNNNSQHDIVYDISCARRAPLRGSHPRAGPTSRRYVGMYTRPNANAPGRAWASLSSNAATHESRGHVDTHNKEDDMMLTHMRTVRRASHVAPLAPSDACLRAMPLGRGRHLLPAVSSLHAKRTNRSYPGDR